MKILIFLLLIFGLNFIAYTQAYRDTVEIHFIKNILKDNHVKDWEEHLRYKQFWEMKNELHIEDSLNKIRKNILYPYESRYKWKTYEEYYFYFYQDQLIKPTSPYFIFDEDDLRNHIT